MVELIKKQMIPSKVNRGGLLFAFVVASSVIAWRLGVVVSQPHQLMTAAVELASVPPFREGIFGDSVGAYVIYTRQTEKGLGLYFLNTGTGKDKLLDKQAEKGFTERRFGMLGWSPDDSLFAYAYPPYKSKWYNTGCRVDSRL